MTRRTLPVLLLAAILPAACALPQQEAARPENTAVEENRFPAEPLPYPEPDAQSQISRLNTQIERLEQQVEQLNERIRQLEHRSPPAHRPPAQPQKTPAATPTAPAAESSLKKARSQFAQGDYQGAAHTLRGAEGGGDGSSDAREQMYLLLQSHEKLKHCQSVINIGQRYAARYTGDSRAAEALYAVGSCQWQIQQQDIARDTWRKLQRRYPDTAAARRAAERMKK